MKEKQQASKPVPAAWQPKGRANTTIYEETSRRFGQSAAYHKVQVSVWQIRSWSTWSSGIALSVVSALTHIHFILWLGLVAIAIGVGFLIRATTEIHEYTASMSAALGTHVGRGGIGPPPSTEEHYRAWCAKHGLAPYPFDSPTASGAAGKE
jgi:hypothetical protein